MEFCHNWVEKLMPWNLVDVVDSAWLNGLSEVASFCVKKFEFCARTNLVGWKFCIVMQWINTSNKIHYMPETSDRVLSSLSQTWQQKRLKFNFAKETVILQRLVWAQLHKYASFFYRMNVRRIFLKVHRLTRAEKKMNKLKYSFKRENSERQKNHSHKMNKLACRG